MNWIKEFFKSRRRLEEERDYLLLWLGGFKAKHRGLSADALTVVAFKGGYPRDYPRDRGDLHRCENAFMDMPQHLQNRVRPLLEDWRDAVDEVEAQRRRKRKDHG